jgi:glyceraldehyde-3-phosphate dehydrogenase [NAD(P)+]
MTEMGPRLEYDKPALKLSSFFDGIYDTSKEQIPSFRWYVNGAWNAVQMDRTFDVDTPIDGTVIARVHKGTEGDMESAIEAASSSQKKIRNLAAIERIEIFRNAAEIMKGRRSDFEQTLTLEAGKPRSEAAGEVGATIERMMMTMEEARKIFGEYIPGDWSEDTRGKIALVIHEPIGVVGAIGPFNFPLYIPAAKVIPALLSGNSVILKPASEDPLSQLLFARVLEEAGIPPGTLNVVTGPGKIASMLASSERVGMVSFTGSTETGRVLNLASSVKPLHLELGGKGLAFVLDDADLDLAASRCVTGSMKNAGQRCDAISAILVQEKVAEQLVQKMTAEIDGWKVGDPRDPKVVMGPLINGAAADRVAGLVADAVDRGAKLLRGGRHSDCFFEPTLLDMVPLDARILWEETFGPVATVARVKSEDDAIDIGLRSKYGLDSCVFTNSFYRMWHVAKSIRAGAVTINDFPRHGVGYFPFGGVKDSGMGREGIGYSIDEMTVLKTIVINIEPAGMGKLTRSGH